MTDVEALLLIARLRDFVYSVKRPPSPSELLSLLADLRDDSLAQPDLLPRSAA